MILLPLIGSLFWSQAQATCSTTYSDYAVTSTHCDGLNLTRDMQYANLLTLLDHTSTYVTLVGCCNRYPRAFWNDDGSTTDTNSYPDKFFGEGILGFQKACTFNNHTETCAHGMAQINGCTATWEQWFLKSEEFYAASQHIMCDSGTLKPEVKAVVDTSGLDLTCLTQDTAYQADLQLMVANLALLAPQRPPADVFKANSIPQVALNIPTTCDPKDVRKAFATQLQAYYTSQITNVAELESVVPWYSRPAVEPQLDSDTRCTVGITGSFNVFQQCSNDATDVLKLYKCPDLTSQTDFLVLNKYIKISGKLENITQAGGNKSANFIKDLHIDFYNRSGALITSYDATTPDLPLEFVNGLNTTTDTDFVNITGRGSPHSVTIEYPSAGIWLDIDHWSNSNASWHFGSADEPRVFTMRMSESLWNSTHGLFEVCATPQSLNDTHLNPDCNAATIHPSLNATCNHDCSSGLLNDTTNCTEMFVFTTQAVTQAVARDTDLKTAARNAHPQSQTTIPTTAPTTTDTTSSNTTTAPSTAATEESSGLSETEWIGVYVGAGVGGLLVLIGIVVCAYNCAKTKAAPPMLPGFGQVQQNVLPYRTPNPNVYRASPQRDYEPREPPRPEPQRPRNHKRHHRRHRSHSHRPREDRGRGGGRRGHKGGH